MCRHHHVVQDGIKHGVRRKNESKGASGANCACLLARPAVVSKTREISDRNSHQGCIIQARILEYRSQVLDIDTLEQLRCIR
jgi:hypothetical protein